MTFAQKMKLFERNEIFKKSCDSYSWLRRRRSRQIFAQRIFLSILKNTAFLAGFWEKNAFAFNLEEVILIFLSPKAATLSMTI